MAPPALCRSFGSDAAHAGATVSPGVERGSAVTHRDVMLQFCSLGDNCDFAAAQRAYQAEPLDLFRWARTPFVSLIRLLDNDFNGLADIKVTRLQSDYRVVCENIILSGTLGPIRRNTVPRMWLGAKQRVCHFWRAN